MKVTETTTLFDDALLTMNKSLSANKDKTLIGNYIKASEKIADGLTFGVAVYKSDADNPYDYYTVRFKDGQFELLEHGKTGDAIIDWKVSQEYLEGLAEEPDKYIDNPMLIDWEWLKSRISK